MGGVVLGLIGIHLLVGTGARRTSGRYVVRAAMVSSFLHLLRRNNHVFGIIILVRASKTQRLPIGAALAGSTATREAVSGIAGGQNGAVFLGQRCCHAHAAGFPGGRSRR